MTLRKTILSLLPVIYAGAFIHFPILTFNLNYFWFDIVLFFIPSLFLFSHLYPWLIKQNWLGPFVRTFVVMSVIASFFEYAALGMNIWFFPDHSRLLGIAFFGAPLEEFMFWWGATCFSLLVYLYYNKLQRRSDEEIAFALITIPFIYLTFQLYKLLRSERVVLQKALAWLVVVFTVSLAPVEKMAIAHGFWKYTPERILCPDIRPWGIPLEEWTIYYILGPILVVLLFHFFALRPKIQFLSSQNNEK